MPTSLQRTKADPGLPGGARDKEPLSGDDCVHYLYRHDGLTGIYLHLSVSN